MSRHLSTAEVARILGLRADQVRALARAALRDSHRRGHRYAFTFRDLVVLRAARSLFGKQIPQTRVRRALAQILQQIGSSDELSTLRLFAQGRDVAVRHEGLTWEAASGQVLLDFDVSKLADQADSLRSEREVEEETLDPSREAQLEFERGLDLEDRDPVEAAQAYARALDLDPQMVDAYVNFGRILHEAGNTVEAARFYRQALQLSPNDPALHFNLGLALEDIDGPGPAATHYERALNLDPDFADAHYNLAHLCKQLGRPDDALRHYQAYQRLTDG